MPSFGIARKRRGSGRMMGSSLGRLFGACWGSEKCSGELEKSIMNYSIMNYTMNTVSRFFKTYTRLRCVASCFMLDNTCSMSPTISFISCSFLSVSLHPEPFIGYLSSVLRVLVIFPVSSLLHFGNRCFNVFFN